MKLLILLSALLASLTGFGPAARAQAVGVEQVLVRSAQAAQAVAAASSGWRAEAAVFRAMFVPRRDARAPTASRPVLIDRLRL